jgi:hypothetical protein
VKAVKYVSLMLGVKCDNRESVHGPKKVALTPNIGLEGGRHYMERAMLLVFCIGFGLWVSYRRFERLLPFKIVRRGK